MVDAETYASDLHSSRELHVPHDKRTTYGSQNLATNCQMIEVEIK